MGTAGFPWENPFGYLPDLCQDKDFAFARTAFRVMALLGTRDWIPFLEMLICTNSATATQAAECLASLPRVNAHRLLIHHLSTNTDPKVRAMCAYGLRGRIGPWPSKWLPAITEALVERLEQAEEHPFVRDECAESLGVIFASWLKPFAWNPLNSKQKKRVIRALFTGLMDPSTPVRFFSCYAVGQMRLKQALPILRSMVGDSAYFPNLWTVGEEAALAMSWIYRQPIEEPEPGRGQCPTDWPVWE